MPFIFSTNNRKNNPNYPVNLSNVFTVESKETINQQLEATITFYPIKGDRIIIWTYENNKELQEDLLNIYNIISLL